MAFGQFFAGAEVVNGRNIRLLLADVDGTLVTDDKVLTEAAKAAVHELSEHGIAFAITSSRPARGMRMLFGPLALDGAIASLNGGLYVNPDLSIIESRLIEPAIAAQAVQLLQDHALDVWVYSESEWLVHRRDTPEVAREETVLQFEAEPVATFTDEHLAHAIKIVGISTDPVQMEAAERAAQSALGNRASALRSQAFYLDITDSRANKGEVVKVLSARLNILPAQIATIGDMPTDALMFHASGFSIAMGNASDAVKAQANAVTDTNDREGFANAVRKFILPGHVRSAA